MSRPALAATRGVEILNFLAAHPHERFTLSELARRVDVNVASTHAVLGALGDAGYVVRDARSRRYGLGPALVAVGTAALEQHPAIDIARDEIRRLAEELDLELLVTARAGDEVVCVAHAGRHQPHGAPLRVGQRVPLVPPLGSVFLAWSSSGEVDAWLARAGASLSDIERAAARAALGVVRANGYSIGLEAPARRELGAAVVRLADEPRAHHVRDSIDGSIAELAHDDYQLLDVERERGYDVSMMASSVFGATGETELALTLYGFPPGLLGSRVVEYAERLRGTALVVTKRADGRLPATA
jgi:DNA-binding IclR family transcriptional regulator